MNDAVAYRTDRASTAEIVAHLRTCDSAFVPPLSGRVDIDSYAHKIIDKGQCFQAEVNGELAGLVAAYCNAPDRGTAFITSVSVLPGWQGRGIASRLMEDCIGHVRRLGFTRIELEVDGGNHAAIKLYLKHGFTAIGQPSPMLRMALDLEKGTPMDQQRDYNAEIRNTADHQYAYNFDFDVIHPYLIRSFEPFFRLGNLLELGSFKGGLTRRFLELFDDITCVEASSEAMAEARLVLGNRVQYVNALFEEVALPRRYDNIVLTHVLEHLDDPVRVLTRINDE